MLIEDIVFDTYNIEQKIEDVKADTTCCCSLVKI